jgi:hypothetical protein
MRSFAAFKAPLSCIRSSSKLQLGAFYESPREEECPSDEECEINWDLMPTGPANDEEELETSPNNPSPSTTEASSEEFPAQTMGSQLQNQLEKFQTRMEVNWQIEECETDEDSCEDFCQDCVGTGKIFCLFCSGTRTLTHGGEFRACIICQEDGKVDCDSCRGTGFIAPWAQTMDDFYHHNEEEHHA